MWKTRSTIGVMADRREMIEFEKVARETHAHGNTYLAAAAAEEAGAFAKRGRKRIRAIKNFNRSSWYWEEASKENIADMGVPIPLSAIDYSKGTSLFNAAANAKNAGRVFRARRLFNESHDAFVSALEGHRAGIPTRVSPFFPSMNTARIVRLKYLARLTPLSIAKDMLSLLRTEHVHPSPDSV